MSVPYTKQVAYIESTGTQYIDAGFKPNQDTRVICSFEQITTRFIVAPFGCESPRYSAYIISSEFRFDYNSTMTFTQVQVENNVQHEIDFNKNNVYLDGRLNTTFTYGNFTAPNLLLFRTTYGGSNFYGRIYWCKVYDNDVLVRDFIPVRVGREGCLYDKVSGELFRNAGTGDFAYEEVEHRLLISNIRRRLLYAKPKEIPNYLCFTALEEGTFSFRYGNMARATGGLYIDYSIDECKTWVRTESIYWQEQTITTPTIRAGEKVYWRGYNDALGTGEVDSNFLSTGAFDVSGYCGSILRKNNFSYVITKGNGIRKLFINCKVVNAADLILPKFTPNRCFESMFEGCSSLVSAPNFHNDTISNRCYSNMFKNCTSLVSVPFVLDYTTLHGGCYNGMFDGCTSLTTSPLKGGSYSVPSQAFYRMFSNCTSLINVEDLYITGIEQRGLQHLAYMFSNCKQLIHSPIKSFPTQVWQDCYISLFEGCTNLIDCPELPAETLAGHCYKYMFQGCTSLTTAPELPATTLAEHCYEAMFKDCTALTVAPILPALAVEVACYRSMFAGCISLVEAPELPATTLATACYERMFKMSDSEKLMTPAMTKAPVLPAPHLADYCYYLMFKGNGNLNEVTCLAEDTSQQSILSTNSWLTNCSSTGTFIKSASATGWYRYDIPLGWTVYSDGLIGISISGYDVIDIRKKTYSIAYNPSDTLDKYKGVTWSVVSGNATITQDGVLTPTAIGNVVIQAVSTYDSTIVATKSITVQEESHYEQQYFTIESLADSNAITIQNVNCDVKPTFYYSLDDGDTWSSVTVTKNSTQNIATINTGDKILFKSTNTNLGTDWDKYNRFNGSKNFKVQGNIMSLLYGDNFQNNTEFASTSANNFAGLFKSTTTVVDASNLILPSTTVYTNSYNGTFRDCANLVHAPELPAINLSGKGCYSSMFEGCISLVEAPELPATTLYNECYARMFCMSRTTKLTTPAMTKSPLLPATTVGTNSYKEMFKGNGNLVEITCLATNVGSNTPDWVANVSSTGTFKKNANMSSWTTGTSGIPSGWTVIDAS